MYESYGIRLYEHAATVKLRACSYQRKDCCHGSESSSAIRLHSVSSTRAARLRDGRSEASTASLRPSSKLSKVQVRSQLRTLEAAQLRTLEAATLLVASYDYTQRFAAAILAASLRLD